MRVHAAMLTLVCLLAGAAVPLVGQIQPQVSEEVLTNPAVFGIPGSHLLARDEQEARDYLKAHPEALSQMRFGKVAAWGFVVGSTKQWYAEDFTSSTRYLVSSTCRAVGAHCYIFVEDSMWNSYVNQSAVDSVRIAFDARTPATPSKGVYQNDVETFGDPPDVDGDPRIIVLILNIRDGFSGTGGFVTGYFSPRNEVNVLESNLAEIYYLDANPLNLTSPAYLRVGMATTAHEFQHMIHFNADYMEITFVNEMCSMVAEVVCGYPLFDQTLYANETNRYLLNWSSDVTTSLADYSRAQRFGIYLRDQFGTGLFKPLVASLAKGIAGIDAGLAAIGTPRRFADSFNDWLIANILDDGSVDPKWGYATTGLAKPTGRTYVNPSVPLTADAVQMLAARYLSFTGGAQLRVTITSTDPALQIKAVEIGPSAKRVLSVTSGVEFSEPEFGTTYTKVHFVVINTGETGSAAYTYVAGGSGASFVEMKWDVTEPTGYFPTSPAGDTVCVQFDGVPGGRLDSVRVALRRAGSMTGGIWRYTGVTRPTPLGTPLEVPITATVATTPGVPYPVPWTNWAVVDLRSSKIDVSQPIAVAFVCEGQPTVQPRVMVTEHPSTGSYHSLTYSTGSTNGPNWYYYTANSQGDTVYLYLIRAYASFGPTDVRQSVELTPRSFALGQNYPNPFNPSTTIRYSLDKPGIVQLAVYNMLGEEVALLLEANREAGEQTITWNAGGLPTGSYIYRLQAGTKMESRKLLILR